jgi:signal transduction histidine kinase/ligand-binding sensor domain-containing protein
MSREFHEQHNCHRLVHWNFLIVFCLLSVPLYADDQSPHSPSDYLIKTWEVEDGLPQSSVTSIAQTQDGYLWLGTFGGLVRFDGVRFTAFDSENTPALINSRILRLYTDRTGCLWVFSERGDVARFSNGEFEGLTERDGVPPTGISVLTEDKDGRLWGVGVGVSGAYRFEDKKFHLVTVPDAIPTGSINPLGSMFALIGDGEGNVWGGEATNLIRVSPSFPAAVSVGKGKEDAGAFALARSRDGGIWVASYQGVRKFRGGVWERELLTPEPFQTASCILEDREGQVWIGTWTQGLFRFNPDGALEHFSFVSGAFSETIRSIFEDKEGNIWVGVHGAGLRRLKRATFKTYGRRDGLESDLIRSVTEDKAGDIWVATQGALSRITPGPRAKVEPVEFPAGLPWTILGRRAGDVWVGTYGRGTYRFASSGWDLIKCDPPFGVEPETTLLFEGQKADLWAGVPDVLLNFSNSADLSPGFNFKNHTGRAVVIRSMAEDASGVVYVGTDGGGLWKREKESWGPYAKTDSGLLARVWSLHADAEATVWAGTFGRGLVRIKNGIPFNFDPGQFGLPRFISSILEDDQQRLWFGSNQGIYSASRLSLDSIADGDGAASPLSVNRYTQSDGLATIECSSGRQPVSWKAKDGRLWFATAKGVAVVDPAHLPANTEPPPVLIEKIIFHSGSSKKAVEPKTRRLADRDDELILVNPGVERLEFCYTGLSFVAPERMRFKYRLFGLDASWTDGDSTRTAAYSHLSPGKYQFRVTAANNDGVWNQTGSTLELMVLPFYHQTWWFRSLVAGGVAGLMVFAFQVRYRRLKVAQIAQQLFSRQLIEQQDSERKRIAAELHDGLGQDLLVIKNRALLGLSPEIPKDAEHFREISKTASQALQQVREIAYNLRPYQLDCMGLTDAMDALVEKISHSGTITFEAGIDPMDALFEPRDENHIFRILQEALNNILKHSGATAASIRVHRRDDELSMTISDNGSGFEVGSNQELRKPSGSVGLSNMKERAGILNGFFQITSSGQGTVITVLIPIPRKKL